MKLDPFLASFACSEVSPESQEALEALAREHVRLYLQAGGGPPKDWAVWATWSDESRQLWADEAERLRRERLVEMVSAIRNEEAFLALVEEVAPESARDAEATAALDKSDAKETDPAYVAAVPK